MFVILQEEVLQIGSLVNHEVVSPLLNLHAQESHRVTSFSNPRWLPDLPTPPDPLVHAINHLPRPRDDDVVDVGRTQAS